MVLSADVHQVDSRQTKWVEDILKDSGIRGLKSVGTSHWNHRPTIGTLFTVLTARDLKQEVAQRIVRFLGWEEFHITNRTVEGVFRVLVPSGPYDGN